MNKQIISVLGIDKPGIIAAISTDLFDLGCNLENVNQMILQHHFAGFFIVEAPEGLLPETILERLEKKANGNGMNIQVQPLDPRDATPVDDPGELFLITTIGPDQKGLVARISKIIGDHSANIVNLKAVFKGGSDPQANVMSYQVSITQDVDAAALFAALRAKAEELDLDIRIQHKNIFDAINKI